MSNGMNDAASMNEGGSLAASALTTANRYGITTAICGHCGATFETIPSWNKLYCDARCRIAAAKKREKARAKVRVPNKPDETKDPDCIYNPPRSLIVGIANDLEYMKTVSGRSFKFTPPNAPFVFGPGELPSEIYWGPTREGDHVLMHKGPSLQYDETIEVVSIKQD